MVLFYGEVAQLLSQLIINENSRKIFLSAKTFHYETLKNNSVRISQIYGKKVHFPAVADLEAMNKQDNTIKKTRRDF